MKAQLQIRDITGRDDNLHDDAFLEAESEDLKQTSVDLTAKCQKAADERDEAKLKF